MRGEVTVAPTSTPVSLSSFQAPCAKGLRPWRRGANRAATPPRGRIERPWLVRRTRSRVPAGRSCGCDVSLIGPRALSAPPSHRRPRPCGAPGGRRRRASPRGPVLLGSEPANLPKHPSRMAGGAKPPKAHTEPIAAPAGDSPPVAPNALPVASPAVLRRLRGGLFRTRHRDPAVAFWQASPARMPPARRGDHAWASLALSA